MDGSQNAGRECANQNGRKRDIREALGGISAGADATAIKKPPNGDRWVKRKHKVILFIYALDPGSIFRDPKLYAHQSL